MLDVAKEKVNKKQLLKKFLDFPKNSRREFFSKEMKLLNDLISRYSIEFISLLSLSKKYDSIAVILSDSFKPEIDKKFREFNYKINTSLYEQINLNNIKSGEDLFTDRKPKTIRGFLNG